MSHSSYFPNSFLKPAVIEHEYSFYVFSIKTVQKNTIVVCNCAAINLEKVLVIKKNIVSNSLLAIF